MKRTMKAIATGSLAAVLCVAVFGCDSQQQSADNGSASTDESAVTVESADGLFVDVLWLSKHANEVVIVDARSAADYQTQHIPGAINLHWTSISNVEVAQGEPGWAEIGDSSSLADAVTLVGIDGTKPVVVYTDPLDGWGEDGRILWMLREAGVSEAYILDGGWTAWLREIGTHQAGLQASDNDPIDQVDTAYVKAHRGSAVLVDARAPEEHNGEITQGEGRIPGAVSIPYISLINEDATVKSADELAAIFEEAGLSPDDELIVYCTGGVRAAAVAEILYANGYENVNVYTAGYSEWAGDSSNEVER